MKIARMLIDKIKNWFNDLHYEMGVISIMSDALEYDLSVDTVCSWLDNNYENHYGKEND